MINYIKVTKTNYQDQSLKLRDLYLDTFTKGLSAQHIESEDAEVYLQQLFERGYAILGFSEKQLVAALIATPPSFDQERPDHLKDNYSDAETLYIAEVLVDKEFRGRGLGKGLFEEFEATLNPDITHVLLRVWSKNEIAVQLYKNSGFNECGSIFQEKLKPISKEPFEMEKIYMLKSY
ncbi:GNAT family N-acetyltransferase [Psychroflexus montanilacus]|uniref:GNAT family N-acetyltransferase n=1 Tax=Psychroflexus montanilacus TaxID=2873598 RepID=UPI001CCE1258|nr:GNAT family N-acetyltransferase [Psychroflexus montanilacus]MBZ9652824.1 GNAT family N-acetyltransferase [Psychroflexus montanilacus]